MRPVSVRVTAVATTLAAAMLLFGCAAKPAPGYARAASHCGMHAVLYCDVAPPVERCHCVAHSDFREMVRIFPGR